MGGRPPILLKPGTPVMRVKEKPSGERPKSLLDRIMMLGEAQDQWRNRVEDKDATNIQELSSYISQSTPSSPYHLSKSQSSLITTSSTSELEKLQK
ncbi:supervillin [Caerostris extrusa]|uniref:Supervillin n=1 Tax=Caerostris extrusa TaxID=172846 RepID=A0AAV4XU55_CAEEX|nr:supervillin [Caerostris extrusa]